MERQKARRTSTSIPTVGSSKISSSGIGQQRQRIPQPLRLASGQLVGLGLEEAAEIGPRDHVVDRQRVRVQAAHQPQHVDHSGV